MKKTSSGENPGVEKGWFEYEEDNIPAPVLEDPNDKLWEEAEEMKAEAEADGEEVDEEWVNERFLELLQQWEDDHSYPDEDEILFENKSMIAQQRQFQRAAEYIAEEFSKMEEVQRVAAFGSITAPLEFEVPRFRKFRRAGVAIRHECKDMDIAVWLSRTDNLRALQFARSNALKRLREQEDLNVAHHQVDVFIIEPGTNRYLGNLCNFAKCPKGKPECAVEGCGDVPYLKLYDDFTLDDDALSPGRIRLFFERAEDDTGNK